MIGGAVLGELVLGDGSSSSPRYSIEEALRRFVMDRVGDAVPVFYLRRPQAYPELPCVTIQKTTDQRERDLTPRRGPINVLFGFRIETFSTDPAQAVALGVAIRGAEEGDGGLAAFSGLMLGRKVITTWLGDESDEDFDPIDGSDETVYSRQTDYSLIAED